MKSHPIDWKGVVSQVTEMGRKISNLGKDVESLSAIYQHLIDERKALERKIKEYQVRGSVLENSELQLENSIVALQEKKRLAIIEFESSKFVALFEKAKPASKEETEYHNEVLDGIEREIKLLVSGKYRDPEDLNVSEIETEIQMCNDRISDITTRLPKIKREITAIKEKIRNANGYIDRKILRRATVVDLIHDPGERSWMTVSYNVLRIETKDVFANTVYYIREPDINQHDGYIWIKMRDRSRSYDKQIKPGRKTRELDRLYEEAKLNMNETNN